MPVDKLSIQDFAAKIKEQHPEYKDVNDTVLAQKIADKYPQYRDKVNLPPPVTASPVDKSIKQTDQNLNQSLEFNGTFKPDLEGEKKGLHLNDPDYQKQKQEYVSKVLTDENGRVNYPVKDKDGNWLNAWSNQPLKNFDPAQMEGRILQVPPSQKAATGGKEFITPKRDPNSGNYSFPGVETPSVPHEQTLPQAVVYGKKGSSATTPISGPMGLMVSESDNQKGDLRGVLKDHPELGKQVEQTLGKYGPEYSKSLLTGGGAMANVLQKTVEDHYDLNKPLPDNVDGDVLNGHLNVLNNFEKNKNEFEANQRELQHQADLITDRAKRTGQSVSPDDVERIAKKASDNIQNWNDYKKSVEYSQRFVQQPEVQGYLNQFQKKQQGIKLMDEIRQRSFPDETNAQIKQDEYDRKAVEGNLNVLDYLKTGVGKAASGISNVLESAVKLGMPGNITAETGAEKLNNSAQRFLSGNLPAISPEAIEQISKGKGGLSLLANDLASTLGGFAPYVVPGMAGEGMVGKAATFGTALMESLPTVRKEAEKEGLTGSAYNTFITAKPLINAAFMTLLPNAKFAKGFEKDVAESIVNGEFNNPKRALLDLAAKAVTHPNDIAHLQAMLSGTAMGNILVNKVTNALQAKDDIDKGISRNHELPTEMSDVFNPKQTAIMALAGKMLEVVPTLKNAIGDSRMGKEVQETYDHIENNLVELAGVNLEGASKKVDELLKKDPGNIYAQHLKTTLENFAHSEARMPEGLEPEQKAALFNIQKQILQKQRQMAYADPVYQPHLQKNIDELNKQIPEILKDEKKANDYLKDAHTNFTENILSPKTENDETKGNAEAQTEGQVTEKPTEGGKPNLIKDEAAPSFLESRHADTADDEKGIVSGPNDKPISTEGRKDANDLAEEVKDKGVTKVITSDLERAKQTGKIVSDKTGATIEHRPELNTWDIGDFDKAKDSEFKKAQEYFVKNPDATEFEGKKIKESFNQYKDRVIKARTELEKEPASTLVVNHSNNMMLWDAYEKNGHEWNEKAENDYLSAKTPEPATLTNKNKNDAPEIEGSTRVDDGQQAGNGKTVVGGNAESGKPSGEGGQSGQPTEKEQKSKTKEKLGEDWPFVDEKEDNEYTSTKNAVTEQKVKEHGLLPAMKEAKREFGEVWDQAQTKLKKGYDIEKLVKDLSKKPRAVTDTENAMILFHQNVKESQLADASKDLEQAKKEGNEQDWKDAFARHAKLLDDLQDIYNTDKAIGRETARGLNARKMMVDRRFSLINMQLEKRASAGGEPLTEEQTAEVKKQYEEIKKTKEALDARVEELEKENAKLIAEKAVSAEKRTTERTKKTKAEFSKERKDIIQRMRDDLLKAAKGGEGLTSSIPLAAQLKAVAPHIRDLVKSFIEQGVDNLEDITSNIKSILQQDIPEIEDRHIHDLIAGEFKQPQEKKEPSKYQKIKEEAKVQKYRATDPKLLKLQADYERAKEKFNHGLQKDQLKTRNGFQKIQDAFLKYERFAKLSNPITLGKLAMAAVTRFATTPIEEVVGAGYSKVIPGIANKAPGEAGYHVRALAKGYKAAFMRGLDDAAAVAKGGKTDIEAVYGKHGHPPPEAIDFFGQLHSAIKAPVKRFAFERSFEKRMANNIKAGTPIDGMVEARIAMEAYKDAQRSIFMQDNPVSRGWSQAMSAMEKTGDTGKLVATIGQWLIPFVKVPTNILAETVSHVAGPEIALGKIISHSLGKGLKNISQEEAESIMRNLKKGTIGHVALMAGYLNPQSFGGYYQKDDKRKPGDVKPGDLRIGDTDVPAWALEAPLFQAMQLGATVRRIKDTMVKGEEKGIGEGVWGGAMGLMSHEPLLDEPSRLMEAFGSAKNRGYFFGELAKSTLVPAMIDYAAKATDPADKNSIIRKIIEPENKRSPQTVKEHVESAIPGLRENVGEKKPTGGRKQRQHR
jgi:broad specificity phosphatase PhoE